MRFSTVCVEIALPISSRIGVAKLGSGIDTGRACERLGSKRLNENVIARSKRLNCIEQLPFSKESTAKAILSKNAL